MERRSNEIGGSEVKKQNIIGFFFFLFTALLHKVWQVFKSTRVHPSISLPPPISSMQQGPVNDFTKGFFLSLYLTCYG